MRSILLRAARGTLLLGLVSRRARRRSSRGEGALALRRGRAGRALLFADGGRGRGGVAGSARHLALAVRSGFPTSRCGACRPSSCRRSRPRRKRRRTTSAPKLFTRSTTLVTTGVLVAITTWAALGVQKDDYNAVQVHPREVLREGHLRGRRRQVLALHPERVPRARARLGLREAGPPPDQSYRAVARRHRARRRHPGDRRRVHALRLLLGGHRRGHARRRDGSGSQLLPPERPDRAAVRVRARKRCRPNPCCVDSLGENYSHGDLQRGPEDRRAREAHALQSRARALPAALGDVRHEGLRTRPGASRPPAQRRRRHRPEPARDHAARSACPRTPGGEPSSTRR